MSAEATLLIINYRSAALTRNAVRSARQSTARELAVIIVDNSLDRVEEEQLAEIDDAEVRVSSQNLGYAAAINSVMNEKIAGVVVVSNPDVEFDDGAIDLLCDAVESGAAAAGPRFYWDSGRNWLLPPPETMSFPQQLVTNLAGPSLFHRFVDRVRLRKRLRFWQLRRPTPVAALSGAVLALDPTVYRALGGMDPAFTLYFEEVDFARRALKAGFELVHVPAASCRHIYDQSAAKEPMAAEWFEGSRRIFNEKWYGKLGAKALNLKLASSRTESLPFDVFSEGPVAGRVVIELSAEPTFRMSAGSFPADGRIEVPWESLESSQFEEIWFRAVELDELKVLWTTRMDRGDMW